ncbi:MAG: response regulator transcription factor [Bacteroidota bacterium]
MPTPTQKILIVEDDAIIAENIDARLRAVDFKVAGIAYDSETAIDMLANRQPDAVLLDINIAGSKDGIEVAEIINQHYQIPFIYLTSYSDKATLQRAKVTMPYGYIVKPFNEQDLLSALEMALYRHTQQQQSKTPTIEAVNAHLLHPLTKKEFEIALDICEGLTNKQLCEKHFVSLNTIKYHVKNLYMKLNVHHRPALMKWMQAL